MTDTTHDDLVRQLRDLGDHASFEPHMHHTAADRIGELEAKLTGAIAECERIGRLWHDAEAKLAQQDDLVQAAVAAALEKAVWQVRSSVPGHMLVCDTERICEAILALITPDAQAALDRVVAETKKEGMVDAANIIGRMKVEDRHMWTALDAAQDLIRAAIREGSNERSEEGE
jgi:hypothetical protein